ncbi:MAG: hypothetical protein V9G24_10695 [Rhodoblastus sp.]
MLGEPISDASALPRAVAAIRQKILQACATRDIEALRIPIDWNEVRPLFERGAKRTPGEDPIERLKALSFDGKGQEILALLRNVLRQAFVVETRGKAQMYVWPAFALKPPADPSPEERQIMLACVRFADLGAIRRRGPAAADARRHRARWRLALLLVGRPGVNARAQAFAY